MTHKALNKFRMLILGSSTFLVLMALLSPVVTKKSVEAAEVGFQLNENFDHEPTGQYTLSQLEATFNPPWENGFAEGMVSVVDGTESFSGKSLKVKYPKNWTFGGLGAQFINELPTKHDELYYSYRVKFANDFNFVKGGKLPGIAGGLGNTGNKKPTGYDGWSVRTMWRRDGAIVQYVYHPDQIEDHGDDLPYSIGGQKYFTPGKWHLIQGRVKLNTPGQHDGIVQAWLDGSLAVDKRDLRFREVDGLEADKFRFETFFGGNDSTWASSKDEYTTFDNIQVSNRPFSEWGSTPVVSPSPTPSTTPPPAVSPSPSPSPTVTPAPTSALPITFTKTKDWGSGFCVEFKVVNNTATKVSNWKASFNSNQAAVTSTWSGAFTKTFSTYSVNPVSWALLINPGANRTFGYCADKTGVNYLPSDARVLVL